MTKEALLALRKAGHYMMLGGAMIFGIGGFTAATANGILKIKDHNDPILIEEKKQRQLKEQEAYNLHKAEYDAQAEAYAKEKVAVGLDKVERELAEKKRKAAELEKKVKELEAELEEAVKKPSLSLSINTAD